MCAFQQHFGVLGACQPLPDFGHCLKWVSEMGLSGAFTGVWLPFTGTCPPLKFREVVLLLSVSLLSVALLFKLSCCSGNIWLRKHWRQRRAFGR